MHFHALPNEIPAELMASRFILRPITVADVELDYDALMESRDYLRLWEQTGWPEDDFTVEANREDLELLERRHLANEAFTYTVLSLDRSTCLGCVYLMPNDARSFTKSNITPTADASWHEQDVAVYFWVRESELPAETDRRLLESLRQWLVNEWEFELFVFVTSELFEQQVALFERAGLQPHFTIVEPGKPGRYLAFGA